MTASVIRLVYDGRLLAVACAGVLVSTNAKLLAHEMLEMPFVLKHSFNRENQGCCSASVSVYRL
jgi:hypothetical protein